MLSFAAVYHDDRLVPFPATQYSCTSAFSYRDLEPGEPIVVRWALSVGGADMCQAPAGSYRFVADLLTHPYDLSATFVIT